MLDFFRRHQRYFFLITTVVIVISFSFFGTYNSLSNGSFREQIAFTTINGTAITRHELDEMALFLGTDAEDKVLFGGAWGPNFLNDGVLKKNFLLTGLASQLILAYPKEMQPDLAARAEKERRFSLYVHPQARFIGTESAWNYFSPDMAVYYRALRSASDPLSPQALHARTGLFLMERQFPAPLLKQVLHYQEKQYSWLSPDRALDTSDLSLFGYHTLEDWFGPRFVRLAAEFIINTAEIAEQRGYQVSKSEALAELIRNAELSFQQNARTANLGVANGKEYFNEQLRLLGMDQNKAAKLWRRVLLSRRLFQDLGSSVFVDPATFEKIDAFALASVEGQLFRLPKALQFSTYRSLQKFEVYLDAVSKRSDEEKAKLVLPKVFLTAAEVAKKHPELVEKRYTLEVAQASKKALEANVGIKDSWNWELSDKGWGLLKQQFPELALLPGATHEERFASLESQDDKTRSRVDAFARSAIVDEHPEWLEQALEEAPLVSMAIGLHEKGGKTPFSGLENNRALMQLLDAAPLPGQEAVSSTAKEAAQKLAHFSADQKAFYRIAVIERSLHPEVLSFARAEEEGVLDKLLDSQLEAYFLKNRETFQGKPFSEVKDLVADKYFEKTLLSIRNAYASANEEAPAYMIGDYAATLRFYPYMREMKEKLEKNPAMIDQLTREASTPLASSQNLADQWKVERSNYMSNRSKADQPMDRVLLFSLAEGAWTSVNRPANGDLNFFHLEKKGNASNAQAVVATVSQARTLLSEDAQQHLMESLLQLIKEKNAISLEYMNQIAEVETEEAS